MRVILSRKGFDTQNGGVPSPILPDGRMVSFPIPDKRSPVPYREIHRDGISLGVLVDELTGHRIPPSHRAHLDPDLDPGAVERPVGWRPIFGQTAAALGHLTRCGVQAGDLFLFFGLFRPAEQVGGHWRYVRGTKPVHAVWGWMLIGAVHSCRSLPDDVALWAAGHPHLNHDYPGANRVFVAADEVALSCGVLPGSGLFAFHSDRVLTIPGANASSWRLPVWMNPAGGLATLSYHGDLARWSTINAETCRLSSVSKGQEFVLTTDRADLRNEWLARVFR